MYGSTSIVHDDKHVLKILNTRLLTGIALDVESKRFPYCESRPNVRVFSFTQNVCFSIGLCIIDGLW